jgi:hypothetical protein
MTMARKHTRRKKKDRVHKEKDDLCEKLKDFFLEVVWLSQATCQLVKFKDFEMVKLSWVTLQDKKKIQRFFQSGLIVMGDLSR